MSEAKGSRRQRNAPTISDVAARAEVSPMTVSRVINGESNVRAETRKRVEAAIAALDYSPSRAARTLAGGEEIPDLGDDDVDIGDDDDDTFLEQDEDEDDDDMSGLIGVPGDEDEV